MNLSRMGSKHCSSRILFPFYKDVIKAGIFEDKEVIWGRPCSNRGDPSRVIALYSECVPLSARKELLVIISFQYRHFLRHFFISSLFYNLFGIMANVNFASENRVCTKFLRKTALFFLFWDILYCLLRGYVTIVSVNEIICKWNT